MTLQRGTGWMRDLADVHDYDHEHTAVKSVLKHIPITAQGTSATPSSVVDLRAWCSPIEDQGDIGSCTANAAVGMMEYFQRKAFNKYINGSRLFVYKTTRNLLKWTGDDGAYLRTAMQALVEFGVPPEEYWPYVTSKFNDEPSAFLYTMAQSYQAQTYYRLDPAGTAPAQVLQNIKAKLSANLPSIFGFTVYASIPGVGDGKSIIPFPTARDKVEGGHAVMVVGYDDNKQTSSNSPRGALLIRNSWGTQWGEKGYGWLPYEYVLRGLASDFWSMVQAEFLDSELFK